MFYVGFLSTSIPYALFVLVTVFYLGYNYIKPDSDHVYADKTNQITVDSKTSTVEQSQNNYHLVQKIHVEQKIQSTYSCRQNKPSRQLLNQTNNKTATHCLILWARPPPSHHSC